MKFNQAWKQHGFDVGLNLLKQQSLPRAWLQNWRSNASAPVMCDDDEQQKSFLNAADVDRQTSLIASYLRRTLGVRRGDRVMVSGSTSVPTVLVHCALMRAGIVVVPANLQYTSNELTHIANDADVSMCIFDDVERTASLHQLASQRKLLSVMTPKELISKATQAANNDLDAADLPTENDDGVIAYTSGTTGKPKGAVLSHGNLLASAEALRIAWRWRDSDRLLLSLPLFHIHGLGVGVHGTLLSGASMILNKKFDMQKAKSAIEQLKPTLFFSVPTIYTRLVSHDDDNSNSNNNDDQTPESKWFRSMRLCVSGSAALSVDVHERFERSANQRILERYGMTETIMLVSNPYEGERRAGTVGLPLPGVDLMLDDETKEILVKGPNVFKGYFRRDNTNVFTNDGYFRTGDVGEFDEKRYLKIVSRMSDVIKSGGYNVYPREIEDALRQHESIHDIAVVGVPDKEFGELVVAFVELNNKGKSSISLQELQSFARQSLASYKIPRAIRIVDELPRNALGKITKNVLKQLWQTK